MRLKIFPSRWRLLAIGIVYLAVMLFGHLADHLILFPTRAPLDPRNAVRKAVPFENGELEIWTARSRKAQQQGGADVFILRFYGNADRADRWAAIEANMWNERAMEIWGMNYPGFGGSTGPARLSKVGPAALVAFDELQREVTTRNAVVSDSSAGALAKADVPSGSSRSSALETAHATKRPIVVFGTSIGATAALHVAASRRSEIAGAILQNPPPLRQMILRQFGWWNLWLLAGPVALQVPRDLDSIANAKASRAPAIFLSAEKDEMVAPRFHRLVANAYGGQKQFITLPGAHHNDPIEGAALTELNEGLVWLLRNADSSFAH